MQITTMGLPVIPLGIILFIFKYEWLLYLTIFFSGFTGSSILNIASISVQPAYYLFILFIIRYIFVIIRRGKIVKPNRDLFIFIIIAFLSLIMPVLLDGKNVIVLNPDDYYAPVTLTYQNITQYLYLLFGFFSYWVTKNYLIKFESKKYIKFIKIFLYSGLIISILGIYQQIAYKMGLPFDEIFRQGVHGNIQPYGSFIRVYSVFIEPSMYSIFIILSIILCIYVPQDMFKYKNILLFLLLINGIMSTSSTFFIGILIIGIVLGIDSIKVKYSYQDREFNKYILLILLMVVFSILLIICINPNIISSMLQGMESKLKGDGISANARSVAFNTNVAVAFKYPLFGVGFGSVRSYDLISTWLASVGFIGVLVFIVFLVKNIINLLKIKNNSNLFYIYKGYTIGISTIFILMFISVPEPYGLFIWISIALLEITLINLKKINNF